MPHAVILREKDGAVEEWEARLHAEEEWQQQLRFLLSSGKEPYIPEQWRASRVRFYDCMDRGPLPDSSPIPLRLLYRDTHPYLPVAERVDHVAHGRAAPSGHSERFSLLHGFSEAAIPYSIIGITGNRCVEDVAREHGVAWSSFRKEHWVPSSSSSSFEIECPLDLYNLCFGKIPSPLSFGIWKVERILPADGVSISSQQKSVQAIVDSLHRLTSDEIVNQHLTSYSITARFLEHLMAECLDGVALPTQSYRISVDGTPHQYPFSIADATVHHHVQCLYLLLFYQVERSKMQGSNIMVWNPFMPIQQAASEYVDGRINRRYTFVGRVHKQLRMGDCSE